MLTVRGGCAAMPLSPKLVDEFIEVWRQEYGEELSREEAELKTTRFVEVMRLLATLVLRARKK